MRLLGQHGRPRVALTLLLAASLLCAPTMTLAAPSGSGVDATKAAGAAAQAELDAMRADLANKVADYTSLSREIEQTRQDVSEVASQAAEMDASLERARAALRSRAIQLYRNDRLGMLEVLFDSRSVRDLVVRTNYLLMITERDSLLLNEVRRARTETLWLQQSLAQREAKLGDLQVRGDEQLRQIQADIASQEAKAAAIGAGLASVYTANARGPGSSAAVPSGSAPTGQFNRDYVISEANFRNSASMSVADIQAFLDTQPGTLASYRAKDRNGQQRSVAEMIAEASVAFQVNPKVILATLQKEQSLLTNKHPTQEAYNWAMGAGKADTFTAYQYMGFGKQIWWGAQKQDNNAKLWAQGKQLKIDGSYVHPTNPGTFAQYRYTPHYRGVMSFWLIYWRYFGDPLA